MKKLKKSRYVVYGGIRVILMEDWDSKHMLVALYFDTMITETTTTLLTVARIEQHTLTFVNGEGNDTLWPGVLIPCSIKLYF